MSIRGGPAIGPESAVPAGMVSTSPPVRAGSTAKSAMIGAVTIPRSRRALLAGLAGGAAALAAGALRGLPAARGGVDGDVVLGSPNSATTTTGIASSGAAPALEVASSNATGHAIHATSTAYPTVFAESSANAALYGVGHSSNAAVLGQGLGTGPGVLGSAGINHTDPPSYTGIFGFGNEGVIGQAGGAFAPNGYVGVQGYTGDGDPPTPAAVTNQQPTGVYGSAGADTGIGVWGEGASTLTSDSVGVLGEGDTGVLGVGSFGALGSAAAAGIGVYGSVSDAPGVPAVFGKTGVIGQADAGGTGVVGFTGLTAPIPPPDTGIYGRSNTGGANGRGLTGYCASGVGLLGQTNTGVGVRAYCGTNTGVGLRVTGKAAFDRSGKLTISAGHSSLAKTGIALTSASFILATLQTNVAGLFIQAVVTNPGGSSFTVYLNKAPTKNVAVAWLAVN